MLSRVTILFLLLASTVSFAADPEPYLKSASMPFYPPLCRSARISGIVTLHFTVNENGDTSYVEAVSGHQLLRDAAIQNVQSWKFAWPHPGDCHVKREVVFVYSIGDWLDDDGPNSIVKWFGKGPVQRVEVQAGSISVQP